MLPAFLQMDFDDVLTELRDAGFAFDPAWFAPHFEFRFPLFGQIAVNGMELSLRGALEPWHVMGEGAPGGTVRYVDSSVERLEVRVTGLNDNRHVVTVNGRALPLQPTGTVGEYVAGVRYKAWSPPSALHPTLGVHAPLTFDIVDTWLHARSAVAAITSRIRAGATTRRSRSMHTKPRAAGSRASSRWGIRRGGWMSRRPRRAANSRSRSTCGGRDRTMTTRMTMRGSRYPAVSVAGSPPEC